MGDLDFVPIVKEAGAFCIFDSDSSIKIKKIMEKIWQPRWQLQSYGTLALNSEINLSAELSNLPGNKP